MAKGASKMSQKNLSVAQNGQHETVDFNALAERFKNGALSFDDLTRQMLHGLAIEQSKIPSASEAPSTTMVPDQPEPVRAIAPTPEKFRRNGNLTVSELINHYMRGYTGRDNSRGQRLNFWIERVGSLTLNEIDDDHIRFALEDLAKRKGRNYHGKDADGNPIFKAKTNTLAAGSINRYSAALSAVFSHAIHEAIAPKGWANPCGAIKAKREDNARVRFLSDDERARLLQAAKESSWPMLRLAIVMAITTGCRRSELANLKWGDVDLEAGTAILHTTKNKDKRVLILTPKVIEALREYEGKPSRHVFASRRSPDQPYQWERVWQMALRAAKIHDFHWHDLRHSCASYLAMNGASLVEIAEVLGHRELSVTKRYSHLSVTHKAKLINNVMGTL